MCGVFCHFRLRQKRKVKKYGLLSSSDDTMEMAPLEEEDEDEDLTVFEMNNHRK